MATKFKITSRVEACTCGCQGQDPWHARQFLRVVREVVEGSVHRTSHHERIIHSEIARGKAKFPWGEEEVVAIHTHFDSSEALSRRAEWYRVTVAQKLGLLG